MSGYMMDTTVLGGLPVTIEYEWQGADRECGLSSGVEEWTICEIKGRKCKKAPDWLYARIAATKGEEDRIVEECASDINNYRD